MTGQPERIKQACFKPSVWIMSSRGVKKAMNPYSTAGHGGAVCQYPPSWLRQGFSIILASFGRILWAQAKVGTCPHLQCWVSHSPPTDRELHNAKTSPRSWLYLQSLALCLVYSRCSVNTCQMTECIMPASGCLRSLCELARSEEEENFWTPATPYISSIFSEA
nr:uncharacterized protein C22orf24 homolog [Microcebus murinus]XP_012619480.1 uncharacterized protein C22orf24 homolog [Microcebus murinus]